ncbi:hypothetical protein [Rhodanobacter lindaniclasticus]
MRKLLQPGRLLPPRLLDDSAFITCLASLFASLATVSTVLALFQPGSTPLV